jgi:large conductance mechanosensitive channel
MSRQYSAAGKEDGMGLATEFREFAAKGNVVDLAVGVIIGAAFGKIVDSLVKDLVMPIIGRVFGGLDFSNHFVLLASPPPGYAGPMTYEALTKAGVPLFAWGNFITVCVNFIILAFIIFMMVRQINRLRRAEPPPPDAPAEDTILLREIRDALRR